MAHTPCCPELQWPLHMLQVLQLCTLVHMVDVPPTVSLFLQFHLPLKASYVDIVFRQRIC